MFSHIQILDIITDLASELTLPLSGKQRQIYLLPFRKYITQFLLEIHTFLLFAKNNLNFSIILQVGLQSFKVFLWIFSALVLVGLQIVTVTFTEYLRLFLL